MENSLSEKRQYYRVSLLTRGIMLLGGIIFLAAAGLSYSSEGLWTALGFLGFGLLSLAVFILSNDSVYISQSGIGARWFKSESFIRWEDIGEARHKSNENLTLISTDQMTKVKINGMLQNYAKLVDVIRQMRPDLWQTKNLRMFHTKRDIFIMWIVMVLFFLGLGLAFLLEHESESFFFLEYYS